MAKAPQVHIDPGLIKEAGQGSLQAKEALMEAYLAAAKAEETGRIEAMKCLFAAEDLATELFKATGEERFQRVIETCQKGASDTMTEGVASRLPKFLRKKL